MNAYLLRRGEMWKLGQENNKAWCCMFQLICKQYGSQARWLPGTGTLVTPDDAESEKDFPYEDWLRQAWMVTQKTA